MSTPTQTPASQIEKRILENPCTSNWLRSIFRLAIRRDPVDALQDAELLVTALRARALDAFSVGATFNAQLTAGVLQQHADALGQLAKDDVKDVSPSANARFKGDISILVKQIHQVARDLQAASPPRNGEPASASISIYI